jgi:hypothetical protein
MPNPNTKDYLYISMHRPMRKAYLILSLLGLAAFNPCQAQTDTILPLLENNKIWSVCEGFMYGPNYQFSLLIGQTDSIIGNYHYKPVIQFPGRMYPYDTIVAGWIREDSMDRVYFLDRNYNGFNAYCSYNDSVENLLYDFSLKVGDTLKYNVSYYNVISNIDSIVVKGVKRKEWVKSWGGFGECNFGFDTIIEGIGSSKGLLYPRWNEFEWEYQLMCVVKDSSQIYRDTLCTCSLISGLTKVDNNAFKIYPNPTDNYVIVETDETAISGMLQITDATGREVFKSQIVNRKSQIQTSSLTGGIYFVKVSNNLGRFAVKKLIIE